MKNFFFLLIAIVFMASCNDEPQAQYDLGVKKVSDPFCGVFANLKTPFFVGSLDWPVFKQIGFKPDSINSTAYYFNVDFDEESVRQKAKANFCILDEKKKPLEGVDLYCNGKKTDDGHFSVTAAKGAKQRIDLRIDIPYEWSDTIVNGYIAVDESQIDEVNEIDLQESNIVGTFHAAQEICLSWGFWLMWLLLVVVALCIVALVLWLLYHFLIMVIRRIASFFSSLDSKVRMHKKMNELEKKNKKEKKKKQTPRRIPFFEPRIGNNYSGGLLGVKTMVFGASAYCPHITCLHYLKCTRDSQPYDDKCPEYSVRGVKLHDTPTDEVDNFLDGEDYSTYKIFSEFLCRFYKKKGKTEVNDYSYVWNHIGFQEYVQHILGGIGGKFVPTLTSDVRDEDFLAFSKVLSKYSPKLIIVWGKAVKDSIKSHIQMEPVRGWDEVCRARFNGQTFIFCFLHHPSMGFSYDKNLILLEVAYDNAN